MGPFCASPVGTALPQGMSRLRPPAIKLSRAVGHIPSVAHAQWTSCLVQAECKAAKLSTMLPMRHYFFVPGQRFRELYYWDTYWIVRGLLVSGMLESAKVRAACSSLEQLARVHGLRACFP